MQKKDFVFTKTMVLAMKLTILLLTVGMLHVSARTMSQTITYTGNNVQLEKLFPVIKEQTGYVVFCNAEVLDGAKPVSVSVTNVPIEIFLDQVLKDQPLEYTVKQKTIVINRKNAPTLLFQESYNIPQVPPIRGRVINEKGEPVVGATIKIKGVNRLTTTNADGEFTIEADGQSVLIVTATNIESLEIKLNGRKELIISANTKTSDLDETIVVAYGKTTQRYTTSNIATVTSKIIDKQPVTNPLLALQGLVPGLVIQQQSGFANAGIALDIRGQGSLAVGSAPLYVVDGVPYPSQMLTGNYTSQGYSNSGSNGFGAQTGNTLAYINPGDIENISILKDADATSIYGSRAAGGAILITTKKGKVGPTKVTFDLQQGWSKLTRFAKVLDAKQYLEMRHEAFANSNIQPGETDFDLNGTWDTTRNTDWQKTLLGGTGKWSNASMSISGGSSNTQYRFSGTYHRETSIFPNPTNDHNQKVSSLLDINSQSTNRKFLMNVNVAYQADYNKLPGSGNIPYFALILSPVAPALFNSDGSLNWQPDSNGNATWANPLAGFYGTRHIQQVNNLMTSANMVYKILPTMEIVMNAGYTNLQQAEYNFDNLNIYSPEQRLFAQRRSLFLNGHISGWNLEPQVKFFTNIGKSHLEALAGVTYTQQNSAQQQISASGYISDELMEDPRSGTTFQIGTTTASLYRYNGYFSRINYRLKDKYLVSLNGRYDGSSRFGSNNKFYGFGSLAASWIFSNEDFFKISWLSFGKLTGSYGTAGNEQIGDYQYNGSYYSQAIGNNPYQGMAGLYSGYIPNPNLQWEVQRKLEARLDLGFLRDRIFFSASYYRNRSSNQLLAYRLPHVTGFDGYTTNLPATIQNSGTEFTLRANIIKTSSFLWSSSVNITMRNNKLISFPGLEKSTYFAAYIIGQPFSGTRIYKYAGVDPQTGTYEFVGADGKNKVSADLNSVSDKFTFLNTQPIFYGGWQNTITYHRLQLDLLFQFSKQRIQNNFAGTYYPGANMYNQPLVTWLNRWQKPGDNASVQKFAAVPDWETYGSPYFNTLASDFQYPMSYYVRLKNISLSWQLPQKWISAIGASDCSIFGSAQNLLTITNYEGTDPETGSTAMAPLRMITTGVKVTF